MAKLLYRVSVLDNGEGGGFLIKTLSAMAHGGMGDGRGGAECFRMGGKEGPLSLS